MCDWSKETLIGEAEFFLETPSVPRNIETLRYIILNVFISLTKLSSASLLQLTWLLALLLLLLLCPVTSQPLWSQENTMIFVIAGEAAFIIAVIIQPDQTQLERKTVMNF
jgi:hypothetical protein